MGIDAAISVTAVSALPQMTRPTPSSDGVLASIPRSVERGRCQCLREKLRPASSGTEEHLIKAAAAALNKN
jgi:hypothetical protein